MTQIHIILSCSEFTGTIFYTRFLDFYHKIEAELKYT